MRIAGALALISLAWSSIGAQAALALTNSPAPAPAAPPPMNFTEMLLKLVGAFFVVFAVFFIGVFLFKRTRLFPLYQSGPAQLKVLESKPVGYRNSLVVVGYQQQRFLVAVSTQGVNLLSTLPEAPSGSPEEPPGESPFSQKLNALQGRKP